MQRVIANTPDGKCKVARVLIVDDHPIVRYGLAVQISLQRDLEVCGEAEDTTAALAAIDQTWPDIIVVDVSLKTGNGIDLIKVINSREHPIPTVVWSMHPEHLYAERALRAGAKGFVHKGREVREIIEAIRTVRAGRVYLSEEISAKLLGRMIGRREKSDGRSPIETLSDRELEVFRLIGQGLATLEIAESRHVSPKTVETYRLRIKEKLGLTNFTELVHRATRWSLENGELAIAAKPGDTLSGTSV